MTMRITDLLNEFYDESLPTPIGEIPSSEAVLDLTRKKLGIRQKRRGPIGLLIATMGAVMSVTAGAAWLRHSNTVALIESGPNTGGYRPVEVDNRSRDVIERASQDYGMTVTDNGTTVTLDSIMGFHAEKLSVVYLTLTLELPEGTEFTADIQSCGFFGYCLPTFDGIGAEGSEIAVWNEDGSVSVMLMGIYEGDVNGLPMELHLSGFGNVSKEVAPTLYSGEREIEVQGTWDFSIDRIQLADPVEMDASELGEDAAVYVSDFGGYLRNIKGGTDDLIQAMKPELEQIAPEIDWDNTTLEQLKLMCAAGDIFTQEQQMWLDDLFEAMEGNEYFAAPYVTLIYPDGTEYAANSVIWSGTDGAGNHIYSFLFEAPQDLLQAEYLSVNGVLLEVNGS